MPEERSVTLYLDAETALIVHTALSQHYSAVRSAKNEALKLTLPDKVRHDLDTTSVEYLIKVNRLILEVENGEGEPDAVAR